MPSVAGDVDGDVLLDARLPHPPVGAPAVRRRENEEAQLGRETLHDAGRELSRFLRPTVSRANC